MEEQIFSFGPYRLGGPHGPLLRDTEEVKLTPQALAVLWLLVSRAGQIVTKEELLQTVWAGTVVSDEALTTCLRRLRRALNESAEQPRYIATVHRIGYRFIAPLSPTPPVISNQLSVVSSEEARGWRLETSPSSPQASSLQPLASSLVGREAELAHLHSLFAKAVAGERQVVFVTGEAGIGKTALIETFWQRLEAGDWRLVPSPPASSLQPLASSVSFAHGQCIEQYGAGEAYLPLLEALSGLCRRADGEQVVSVLRRVAPTWLVQLPALLNESDYAALQQKVAGTTRERMLREVVEALEALSRERPLVLVLEDVHWSDASTIDVLNLVARRRESARLFIVVTYRPTEVIVNEHPLKRVKQELVTRGHGVEVVLGPLGAEGVAQYLQQRWGVVAQAPAAAAVVYRRTEGHPLFMVQVVDYLTQRDQTPWHGEGLEKVEQLLPQQLRQLLEVQLEQLTAEEQQVLEVGSVAGASFPLASVAVGMERTEEEVETVCERLAQRGQFIVEHEIEKWPDGTISGCYGFRHALYQEVLYQRLGASRRARLHTTIGERLERGYDSRVSEVAAELAMHFERGRDTDRTVLYLQRAGENALRRYAYQEALRHCRKGAEVLQTLPETADRARRELALQFLLIQALVAVTGHASIEVEYAYRHAQPLCEQVGTTQQLFSVLLGLFRLHNNHCEHQQARERSAQCLILAQREQDPALLLPAYYVLGASELYLGNFAAAKEYLTQGMQCYDPQHNATYIASYANTDPYTSCRCYAAMVLWYLGYPDQAVQGTAEILQLTKDHASPLTVAGARNLVPLVYHCCRQGEWVQEQGEEGITVATRMGFPFWRAIGLFWRGWGLAEQGHYEEGVEQMHQGLAAQKETGSSVHRVHFLVLLAEVHGHAGQYAEGLSLLAEAETELIKTDERFYEAELWRIKGELTLQKELQVSRSRFHVDKSPRPKAQSPKSQKTDPRPLAADPQGEAEECFLKAIEVARGQEAKSLELRAVMSLVRLRQQQAHDAPRHTQHAIRSRLTEAHATLSEVYNWFTEGFETKDLQEAKALLNELHDRASTSSSR